MLTLTEIEQAVDRLTSDEKRKLHRYLQETLRNSGGVGTGNRAHSILEIETVRVGSVLRARCPEDDLLGEMLEGRQ